MASVPSRPNILLLALGDAAALLLVTLIGFTNQILGPANSRWVSTFIPLCVSWAVLSPWFGAYNPKFLTDPRHLWRIPLVMAIGGPLTAWLRSLWLGSESIETRFVAAISGFAALGITIWRLLWMIGSKNRITLWTSKK